MTEPNSHVVQLTRPPQAGDVIALRSGGSCALADEGDDERKGPRRFKMTAFSGGPVSAYFGWLAVDLSGLEFKTPLPMLEQHRADRRAGVGDTVTAGDSLSIEGFFLGNEVATGIQEDMDDGFPMEASIGFDVLTEERVEGGAKVQVNGHELTGPGYVIRQSSLRETSFVALGRDPNTSVGLLSWSSDSPIVEPKEARVDPTEEALAEARQEGAAAARAELRAMIDGKLDAQFAVDQFLAGTPPLEARANWAGELAERLDASDKALQERTEALAAAQSQLESGQAGVAFQPESRAGKTPAEQASATWAANAQLREDFANDFAIFLGEVEAGRCNPDGSEV